MSTTRHDTALSSQPANDLDRDSQFVVRELELDVSDDDKLGTAAVTVWMNESTKRGGKLGAIVEGVFKLIFKGKWSKSGSPCTRHATVVGQLNGAPPIAVRVRPSN